MRLIDADAFREELKEQYDLQVEKETLYREIAPRKESLVTSITIAKLDAMPTIDVAEDFGFDKREVTVYGYPLQNIVWFAETCRKHDISEGELKNFINNSKWFLECLEKDFKESIDNALRRVANDY